MHMLNSTGPASSLPQAEGWGELFVIKQSPSLERGLESNYKELLPLCFRLLTLT